MVRDVAKGSASLTLEAQTRLNDAIRTRQLGETELEPVVLQQLSSYPDEVQKNVIDRFLATGLTVDVQNKTGWLVGILKRELKAYQETQRFRGLEPTVSKKLENALRTRRLRAEEFPTDIINLLAKCSLHDQQLVVEKFLQKQGLNKDYGVPGGKSHGKGSQQGQGPPHITARTHLVEIIRTELGAHLLQQGRMDSHSPSLTPLWADTRDYQKPENTREREAHRLNLQTSIRLHEDVIHLLLNFGDSELYDKMIAIGNLAPNYLDAEKVWSLLADTSVDEQLRVVREMVTAHREEQHVGELKLSAQEIEANAEKFRLSVEKIMMSYGFSGFGGNSHPPEMKGKIILTDDGVTRFDFSELMLSTLEWRTEFSPMNKRKLKQFMRGKSPTLALDFHGSRVGEKIGRFLVDFFAQQKPNIDVSLVSINLIDTDVQTDQGWNDIASFLITTPARELEITASKISNLSLGVLVHTMFDGEFPSFAPFSLLKRSEPPKLAIALPNNTCIRFPLSNETWVKQWLVAGRLLIEDDTLTQVQSIYQHLRQRGSNPTLWYETPQWNSPINPARVEILYAKLRKEGYLQAKEEEPRMARQYAADGYYYDVPNYDYGYDDYFNTRWTARHVAPKLRNRGYDVFDMDLSGRGTADRPGGLYGVHESPSYDYRSLSNRVRDMEYQRDSKHADTHHT